MPYGEAARAILASLLRRVANRLKREENHGAADKNTNGSHPWWIKHPAVEAKRHSPDAKHKTKERRNWIYQNGLAIATLFVAIVVARYAYFSYFQTRRQADTATDTEMNQLRAYISTYSDPTDSKQQVQLTINNMQIVASDFIKNYGSTPGFEVSYKAVLEIANNPLPKDYHFFEGKPLNSKVALYPSSLRYITKMNDRVFNIDEFLDVLNGSKLFVFYGTITYDDIFKRKHHSNFCITFIARTNYQGDDCGPHQEAD